jgi:gamma-glutamyl phosphate reductase
MDRFLDVIVPRGGKGLIETVVSHARYARDQALRRNLHHVCGSSRGYADGGGAGAERESSAAGVCNAIETVLVHQDVAEAFFARAGKALAAKKVEVRGDATVQQLLGGTAKAATETDYRTEFLDLILAAKVVTDLDEAIAHIEEYGSHHSDGIVTADEAAAERFPREVDSADRLLECVHPLHRWCGVRLWRGDRNQHGQAARARADGAGGAYDLQISAPRHGSGEDLIWQDSCMWSSPNDPGAALITYGE